MLDGGGATVGGTNNVNMTWDGDAFTASSDYTGPGSYSNVTAASTTTFFSNIWSAHDIRYSHRVPTPSTPPWVVLDRHPDRHGRPRQGGHAHAV
jgi:hypothetical protein